MNMYTVYKVHISNGLERRSVVCYTDDRKHAAMWAGVTVPADREAVQFFAENAHRNRVSPIVSFICDKCWEVHQRGEDGPEEHTNEEHQLIWLCTDCSIAAERNYYENEANR
jgi:hypothetical protein